MALTPRAGHAGPAAGAGDGSRDGGDGGDGGGRRSLLAKAKAAASGDA
jgi:hypothetical protein